MNSKPMPDKQRQLPLSHAALIAAALFAAVTLLDYVTGPDFDMSIAYFLPITYAAWALGRNYAILGAILAEARTYADHISLIARGELPFRAGWSTIVVRLLIYLFVAEAMSRLAQSMRKSGEAAEELQKLNEDLHRSYARLDEDSTASGLLQSSFLAFTPPATRGCEVGAAVRYAQRVGGDFADAGIVNGSVYACVGDISGKGTPAALFTALLKHLMNDAHRRGRRGVHLISYLNAALCDVLPDDRFVTLLYVEIDPDTGRGRYVNAGHPEGLVYRANTGEIETLEPTSSLLGFCEALPVIEEADVALGEGDVVVLYTDGATESLMRSGERMAAEMILRLVKEHAGLAPQEMADRICDSIEGETDEEFRDDLTVVCMKRTTVGIVASG